MNEATKGDEMNKEVDWGGADELQKFTLHPGSYTVTTPTEIVLTRNAYVAVSMELPQGSKGGAGWFGVITSDYRDIYDLIGLMASKCTEVEECATRVRYPCRPKMPDNVPDNEGVRLMLQPGEYEVRSSVELLLPHGSHVITFFSAYRGIDYGDSEGYITSDAEEARRYCETLS
jgi:hypothetical protein